MSGDRLSSLVGARCSQCAAKLRVGDRFCSRCGATVGSDQAVRVAPRIELERFFELAVDVFVVTGPDGRFELVNPALSRLLGVDREVILSKPWSAFVHPDDRERSAEENAREFAQGHRTITFENRYVDVHGGIHWMDWSAELDPATGVVYGIARDVTDQKVARVLLEEARAAADDAREAAEAANRAKSEFLSRMSHELRTPLNAILGFSEILKDNLAGKMSAAQQHECLESIHASGRHLLNLVNDVLDLSKIEAGRLELQYEEFELGACISEVLTVVRPLAERGGVTLEVAIENDSVLLRADKGKFKQVLYNLLSNSIKFTPEGGQATVKAKAKPRAGQLVLQVKDTGIGIDPQHHDQIFSEFFQVQAADNRQFEGTGLGLALVRRLVGLHGGTIKVDSQLGRGTTMTVTLPLHGLRPDGQMRNRILVIEDNPSSLELSTLVLRGQGFKVDTATDGQQGLQKAKSQPYDLILMDIQLPGIDGLTVTRLLKADPRTAQTPIVALSARAMVGDEKEALEAGCSGYITKPIAVKNFLSTVTEYLEAQGA